MNDQILSTSGEPCETCSTAIAVFVCFDGIRRCLACVDALAEANEWNSYP